MKVEAASGSTDELDELFEPVLSEALSIAIAAPETLVSDVVSWHGHIPFAQALVAIARPRLVVELGVHKGDSYRAFVDAMARYGVEGRAFGVDTWRGDEHAGSYAGDVILEEVISRNAPFSAFSTLLRKTFDEALADVEDATVDLLHIDGFHTYEAVRHDYETWLPKLSAQAIVLFHDTAVRRGDFGVYRFWEEVSAGKLAHAFTHSNGLGVLCVGNHINARARKLIQLLGKTPSNATAPAKLFESIGNAFSGQIAAEVFKRLYTEKEQEVRTLQSASMAEFERLNAEIIHIRNESGRALEEVTSRLRAEKELELRTLQSTSMAESERLNAEIIRSRAERRVALESATLVTEVHRRLSENIGRAEGLRAASMAELNDLMSDLPAIGYRARRAITATEAEVTKARLLLATAIARPDGLVSETRTEVERLDAEFERLATEMVLARQEAQAARNSMKAGSTVRENVKSRSILAGVQHRRSGILRLARNTAKSSARSAINLLPIPAEWRIRLKYGLIRRYGRLMGLAVSRRRYDESNSAQVALHDFSRRYLEIARAATGEPAEIPPKRVSIIIPVYNQIEYTLRCLAAIERNSGDVEYEIIVVDDCSTDETSLELSGLANVIYIRNSKNLGFIGSCNAGLARATKDYVLFLNNDTEVGPGWLSSLIDTFELNEHVGLVGSKLIYPDGRLQEAGGIIWNDFSGWNWGRMQDPDDPRFNYVRRADYCSGASLVLPRALANALGGFDTEFAPAYGEDSDLAFKVRSVGLSVLYQPLSQVIHYEGVTSGTDVTQGVKAYQVVNARKLAERWAPVLARHDSNGANPDFAADGRYIGRVLVLDQITPEPDRDAGSITALELMRTLRDLGYKVTFVPVSNFTHIPDYTDTLAALGIESVLHPWTQTVRQHLEKFGECYDAVIIFRFNTAVDHLETVRKFAPRARIIYHTSDLHFLREERARRVGNAKIPERSHSHTKTKKAELDIVRKSDLTVLHSQFEQQLLAELVPGKPVVVFPWIYQPRGPGTKTSSERRGMVFLGGYRHYPNVDAVMHFAQDILPLIEQRCPDLVFHAVGSNPPPEMTKLANSNLRIVGFVEDLSPVLWDARMMVVPLRYGAGLKGKIVTALAHGLPVITTSIGAEGMGLTDGVDVIIADEPGEFAAAIERLNTDDALWASLSRAGLDYVMRTTSREVGYGTVETILDHIGLPKRARIPQSLETHQYSAAFGSPTILSDPEALVSAVDGAASGGLLIVPPELANAAIDGWQVEALDGAEHAAGSVVAIVDSTNETEFAKLVSRLPKLVAHGEGARIIFAPPRLVLSGGTYAVKRPFSDDDVTVTIRPPHLQHAERLAALGGTLTWHVDTNLLGFPALMVAHWQR